jgi:hypothetical protein
LFELSDAGAITAFAAQGGLIPGARHEVQCVWNYASDDELLTALGSTGFAVNAMQAAGEQRVTAAIRRALPPQRRRVSAGEHLQLPDRTHKRGPLMPRRHAAREVRREELSTRRRHGLYRRFPCVLPSALPAGLARVGVAAATAAEIAHLDLRLAR